VTIPQKCPPTSIALFRKPEYAKNRPALTAGMCGGHPNHAVVM
jgi:hypothetical protein